MDKEESSIFFSTSYYRNKYFTSDDPQIIAEFYSGFKDRNQLIQWMKDRPKGVPHIQEIEGSKDIIVVIPTSDFEGKYAKHCREEIFRGMHLIFVESGGPGDFYFNFSHYLNHGLRNALKYHPKWIVFSSDDMVKIDKPSVLQNLLMNLNESEIDMVFTEPSMYHSSREKISEPNFLFKLYYSILNKDKGREILRLHKRFNIKYLMSPTSGLFSRLFKTGYEYLEIQSFAIFSGKWVEKLSGQIYDETFINAAEDTDLSLKFSLDPERFTIIDYKIGDLIGTTMGTGVQRGLRSIASLVYLNYKWADILDKKIIKRGYKEK